MNVIFYIRYYLCMISLLFAIWVMPEGEYKEEFKRRVYGLKDDAIRQQQERENK